MREKMVESIAESHDELLEKYLAGEESSNRRAEGRPSRRHDRQKITPVICGTAFKNKGVQPLLDAVVDYLPSPLDIPPVKGIDPDDEQPVIERQLDDDEPFSGLVFKIMTDPFVGQLAFFRVYSGHVESGTACSTRTKGTTERIGRLLQMHANKREEIKEVCAGDIGAAVGLRNVTTGDTICDRRTPIVLETMSLPGAGHRGRHRAEDQDRPGKDGHGARQADAGRPDVQGPHGRRRPSQTIIRAWASCTSRSSSTAWCASSTSARTSASRRSRIARPSRAKPRARAGSSASRAVRASTATSRCASSRSPRAGSSSSTRSSAARSRRSSSSRSSRASRKRWSAVSSPAIR